MNSGFLARLGQGTVLGDGGSVFELERRGYVQAGPFTPEVVLEHPEAVLELHREFVRCGAEVVQALTFYGSADKLQQAPGHVNRSAVRLARQAGAVWVAGGLSPTPTFRQGDRAEVLPLMQEHLEAQLDEGVDLLIGETFAWLEEALTALQAMREAGVPKVITMNIAEQSREGISVEDCARRLEQAGADVVGINCSWEPRTALQAALRMAAVVSCPVACQPIAYRGSGPFESWPDFPLALESRLLGRKEMGDFARSATESGLAYIGGCCGVAPYHVRSMAEALGRLPQASAKSPDLSRHMIPEVRERAGSGT